MHPTTDSLLGKEYKMWDEWKDNHNCGDPTCKWCAPAKEAPEVCPPAPVAMSPIKPAPGIQWNLGGDASVLPTTFEVGTA